jgi:hypothetical protein
MTLGCWHEHVKAFTNRCLCAYCLSSIFGVFLLIQLCLGWNQFLKFTPCTPHHNHPNYLHLTMGINLLCLESITHHGFQFGTKDFEHLLPAMVQASPSFSANSSKTFSHKLTTSVVQCTLSFCGWRTLNHCNKFVVASKTLHSNHSKNPLKFWNSMYYKEPFSSAKK